MVLTLAMAMLRDWSIEEVLAHQFEGGDCKKLMSWDYDSESPATIRRSGTIGIVEVLRND